MGSLFRKGYTKAMPVGATLHTSRGRLVARWRSADGKARSARVVDGKDGQQRIQCESKVYVARYRDGDSELVERSTGCRDKSVAIGVLARWEATAEKVRAGVLSHADLHMAAQRTQPIEQHLAEYLRALEAQGRTKAHRNNAKRAVERIAADCRFRTLAEVSATEIERWLAQKAGEGLGAVTRNKTLSLLRSFLRWCRRRGALATDPLEWVGRANEAADRRRQPRALTEQELERLLTAARARPVHEASEIRRGPRKGQLVAKLSQATRLRLEMAGWERALAYKLLLLTGLRVGELGALKVGDAELDEEDPALVLDAHLSKNRQEARIPLRLDLADDVRLWLAARLELERRAAERAGTPVPLRLARSERLLRVPSVRIFDRDAEYAEIAKRDDRKRLATRHGLRHTGCTGLQAAGAPSSVVSRWMRHLTGASLADRVYTDPRMIEVRSWLDRLPTLSLFPEVLVNASDEAAQATGTDGAAGSKLPPTLPPDVVASCHDPARRGTEGGVHSPTVEPSTPHSRHEKTALAAVLLAIQTGAAERI